MKIKRNNIPVRIGVRSLFLTLLLVLLFSTIVGAQNKEDSLAVDIWSDRGGQGIEVLDVGTYDVGEEITFYLYVSTASQVKWTIRDPYGSEDVREETLEAGTHEYRDVAEEDHVGAWDMTLEAWAGGEYAFDAISFTVAGTEPIFPLPIDPCSEIVGSWSWFDGGTVTIRPDGTMGHDSNDNSGMWDCTDPDEGIVTLRWQRGSWVDTLTLSMDGMRLEGTNNAGMSVSGRRVEQIPRSGSPNVAMLEDDFDSENQGGGTLNYSGFTNWDTAKGTVDLIGHGFWDFFPDHGLYLDLDGSTREAGRLESKTTFKLESGEYRLEFDLAGSPMSGPDTVTVSLGNVYSESFTLALDEPFRTVIRNMRVQIPTNAKLIFDHEGGDSEGLFLDNVKLTKVSGEGPEGEIETHAKGFGLDVRQLSAPVIFKDTFRLSTGELIIGELLSFDRSSFTIRTDKGVIEKKREEITAILLGNLEEQVLGRIGVSILDLSKATEAWAREWTVLSTLTDFGGGEAGFYSEPVRIGDANPNPGRRGILYLHPKNEQEPARITRRLTVTGPAPTLTMGVSGNRDADGDWLLVIKVDGNPFAEERIIAGTEGWQDLTFDLSPFSGQTVIIEIEAWANNWYYEYAFFDYVK